MLYLDCTDCDLVYIRETGRSTKAMYKMREQNCQQWWGMLGEDKERTGCPVLGTEQETKEQRIHQVLAIHIQNRGVKWKFEQRQWP